MPPMPGFDNSAIQKNSQVGCGNTLRHSWQQQQQRQQSSGTSSRSINKALTATPSPAAVVNPPLLSSNGVNFGSSLMLRCAGTVDGW